jgi:ABC-type multidrug transport system fused ATPase/permease subunit
MMAGYHSIEPQEPDKENFETEEDYLKARSQYLRRLREYKEDQRRTSAFAMTMMSILVLVGISLIGTLLFRLGTEIGFLKIGAVALTLLSIYLFFYKYLEE